MADGDVTLLLRQVRDGNDGAMGDIFPLVYRQLRGVARRQLGQRRNEGTLGTTALVHEAYLKLVDQNQANWEDRKHFFAVAAKAMRHIVIDYLRERGAQKRGGDLDRTLLDEARVGFSEHPDEILAVDEALERLAEVSDRLVLVVEMRFFAGLSVDEIAEYFQVSARTVKRDWRKARAFLYRELGGKGVAG